jgi:hypothetical protein
LASDSSGDIFILHEVFGDCYDLPTDFPLRRDQIVKNTGGGYYRLP